MRLQIYLFTYLTWDRRSITSLTSHEIGDLFSHSPQAFQKYRLRRQLTGSRYRHDMVPLAWNDYYVIMIKIIIMMIKSPLVLPKSSIADSPLCHLPETWESALYILAPLNCFSPLCYILAPLYLYCFSPPSCNGSHRRESLHLHPSSIGRRTSLENSQFHWNRQDRTG